ncbi:MAG TPA: hypothetical protein P5527_04825 [Kiritimatiellia bacterium]|nr:hypothetical protein [Kiritimatiellia bacterium]
MNIAIAALAIASSPLFCASLSAIPTAEREVLDCLPGHTFAAHQNWENTDDVTALGTGMQVLTGVFNLDLLADIRDNWYNLTHWSDVSTAQKLIDLIGLLPAIGAVKYADEVGDVIKGGNRAADAARSGKTVLGKYPDYINLAEDLGAKRFNIPARVWDKMSKAEQWAANKKFLDRAISRGDDIILSNPVKDIDKVTGAFRQELDYLVEQGFHLNADGTRMIR